MSVNVLRRTMLSAFVLAGVVACAAEQEFPIYCWTYYPFEKSLDWDVTIDNWVKLGVNHPMSPLVSARTNKAKFRQFLDRCHSAGLKVTVMDERSGWSGVRAFVRSGDEQAYRRACREVRADWGDHPAVVGYHIYDEPYAKESERVFRAAKICQEEMPGKQAHLNLHPWYFNMGKEAFRVYGTDKTHDYLERSYRETGLDTLGYDYYGHLSPATNALDMCFHNLREWSSFAKENGVRWNVSMLCAETGNCTIRSEIAFRWQISVAAAMGANALSWFYPDCHGRSSGNYRNAPINQLGERTEAFNWMGFENRIFQRQFGALFASLKFERAWMCGKAHGGIPLYDGRDQDIQDVRTKKADGTPVLLSFFTDGEGRHYAAMVNVRRDVEGSRTVVVAFAEGTVPMQRGWDEWEKLKCQNRESSLCLAPGQLVLFRLDRAERRIQQH